MSISTKSLTALLEKLDTPEEITAEDAPEFAALGDEQKAEVIEALRELKAHT